MAGINKEALGDLVCESVSRCNHMIFFDASLDDDGHMILEFLRVM